jgi:transmembrane sensor
MKREVLAASIVIASLTASLFAWMAVRDPLYTTEIGERRSITLADGSTVDLNARSKVRIRFSKAERDVDLIEGQALFQVAKNKARPFVVRSGAIQVRAVGTQFDVYRKRSGTTVTVIEGRVAVLGEASPSPGAMPRANPERPPPNPTFVSAGEQVTVTARAMTAPKRADVVAATAWTEQRLILEGSRLSDVVEDFNRFNSRRLIIEDSQLEDFHISGVYSSTDPASLIRFLREQPGIHVTETDTEVRIARN